MLLPVAHQVHPIPFYVLLMHLCLNVVAGYSKNNRIEIYKMVLAYLIVYSAYLVGFLSR